MTLHGDRVVPDREMGVDRVVLMERGGTVRALGLGLGSELRVLGMEGKHENGPKGKFR